MPHRQWVLTVPWGRRKQLAYRPELARGVLQVALDEVFGWLEARALADLGVAGGRAGAVTVEQRFSSSLSLNLHFHSLLPDGVFARDERGRLALLRNRRSWLAVAFAVVVIGLVTAFGLWDSLTDDQKERLLHFP